MRARAHDRDDGHAGFDGHHYRTLFELLQAAIRAARAFGVDQERLAALERLRGFLDAGKRRFAGTSIDGDEMSRQKGLSDDGPFEK